MNHGYDADVVSIRKLASADEAIARTVDATRTGWDADFDISSHVFGDSAAAAQLRAAYQSVDGSADFAVRDMASSLFEGGAELKLIAATYKSLDEQAARDYMDALNRDDRLA